MRIRQSLPYFMLICIVSILSCGAHTTEKPDILHSPSGTTTTFIMVRHAERDDSGGPSALTPKGQQRARDLVRTLGDMGVTAIYSPDRRRNRETVQPLADYLGLSVNLVDNTRLINTRKFADIFVRETLARHAGGVVLWVGNRSAIGIWGGNLKEIFRRLGGDGSGPSRYSDLYFVRVPDKGSIHIKKTNYGVLADRFDQ